MLDMGGIPEKSSELQDNMVLRLELLNVSDDREMKAITPCGPAVHHRTGSLWMNDHIASILC